MVYNVSEKTGQKVSEKTGHAIDWDKNHFARTGESVLYDHRLSFSARCIYSTLARHTKQGTVARIGIRRIANLLGADKSTVSKGLAELENLGHIAIHGTGRDRRTYHLTSSLFGQKQRSGITETAPAPSGGRRLVSSPRKRIA